MRTPWAIVPGLGPGFELMDKSRTVVELVSPKSGDKSAKPLFYNQIS
jgi:hypothetical protein